MAIEGHADSGSTQGVPASAARGAHLLGTNPVQRHRLRDGTHEYFCFVPDSARPAGPIMVLVHGISRNAEAQVDAFADMAQRRGVVLVAPLFGRDHHPRYQRIFSSRAGVGADRVLIRIIEDVAGRTGADGSRVRLFGFSGGAQFAHRFALLHPERVARLDLGSAGWYTFPDPDEPFPWGLRASRAMAGADMDLPGFLEIPVRVFVGERDTIRDASLNRSLRIDRRQGVNRLERGRQWVGALHQAAHRMHKRVDARMVVLPGCGHCFTQSVEVGGLVEALLGGADEVSARRQACVPHREPKAASGFA